MIFDSPSPTGEPNHLHEPHKIGFLLWLFLKITGADQETLRLCPQRDWQNVIAIAEIMIATLVYQTALFSLIGYQLFATEGQIRPDIILAALFLGVFILLCDAYVIMRSSWELSGITELQRGGVDISGGREAKIKNNCFLAVRLSLSIGLAQLTALFFGMLVFGGDIASHLQDAYIKANAKLISSSTVLVDGQIELATESVSAGSRRVDILAAQIATLRGNEVSSPEVRQAQQEVTDLIARKVKAEEDIRTAESLAANELGGVKGASGNSGQAGRGPRYRAAVEQANNARNHVQQVARDLEAARARLEAARRQAAVANDPAKPKANDQLPAFEKALRDETNRLAGLKDELAKLTAGRQAAIKAAVESAPDHVPYAGGFLNRLVVLDDIAHENGRIGLVILLIDFVAFGFECAAVLAKITAYVPTTYAKLLARNSFLQAVKIAGEITAELNGGTAPGQPEPLPSREPEIEGAAPPSEPLSPEAPIDLPPAETPPAPPAPPLPPKRGRGRPRKNLLNGSESPFGKQSEYDEKTGEVQN